MARKIKSIKLLHFDESTQEGERIQQASVLIEIEGERPKLIQGTQVLKGDINGKHTISYTIFDGKTSGKATYSINNIEKKGDKAKINIVGISEGAICCGQNKPVDTTIDISNKTFSANDPSIQCDICQAIVDFACDLVADQIPEDEICAEVCASVCLEFVETLVGYLICVAICATACSIILDQITEYGCKVGSQYLCQKAGYC